MVALAALAATLNLNGVRVTTADFQAFLASNKLTAGMKVLVASGQAHDMCACPLHRGFVMDTTIAETLPPKPLVAANKQGFNVDCLSCFVDAGKTIDHILRKGFVI